jgi:hypothetical protein
MIHNVPFSYALHSEDVGPTMAGLVADGLIQPLPAYSFNKTCQHSMMKDPAGTDSPVVFDMAGID